MARVGRGHQVASLSAASELLTGGTILWLLGLRCAVSSRLLLDCPWMDCSCWLPWDVIWRVHGMASAPLTTSELALASIRQPYGGSGDRRECLHVVMYC
jgi:hypothetical protein